MLNWSANYTIVNSVNATGAPPTITDTKLCFTINFINSRQFKIVKRMQLRFSQLTGIKTKHQIYQNKCKPSI